MFTSFLLLRIHTLTPRPPSPMHPLAHSLLHIPSSTRVPPLTPFSSVHLCSHHPTSFHLLPPLCSSCRPPMHPLIRLLVRLAYQAEYCSGLPSEASSSVLNHWVRF